MQMAQRVSGALVYTKLNDQFCHFIIFGCSWIVCNGRLDVYRGQHTKSSISFKYSKERVQCTTGTLDREHCILSKGLLASTSICSMCCTRERKGLLVQEIQCMFHVNAQYWEGSKYTHCQITGWKSDERNLTNSN